MVEFLLILCAGLELLFICVVFFLFFKVKKSQEFLLALREKQKEILDKLRFNEELEKQLIESFKLRQKELVYLDKKLKEKIEELKRLIKCAEDISSSPQLLKEAVLRGYRKGISVKELCKHTGLSEEEIELIIDQYS